MQEVFVKLFLNNRDFANETHEKAWIIRVTINLCKNSLKRKDNNYLELNDNESITGDFEHFYIIMRIIKFLKYQRP